MKIEKEVAFRGEMRDSNDFLWKFWLSGLISVHVHMVKW